MGSRLRNTGLSVSVALGRCLRRAGFSVLAYHSIDESGSYMSTPVAMFRIQMEWLRDHGYRVLSMRQLFEAPSLEAVPAKTVVLTFDDGLANFADAAWPVLRELGHGATVYVPTAFIGGDAAWYAHYDLPRMACMSWETLRALGKDGADVQSHAHQHRDLATLPPAERDDEMRRSRAVLESGLAMSVEHLAYPFGTAPPVVRASARQAGYRSAVILGRGRCAPGVDPLAIPRDSLDRITLDSERAARLSIEACVRGTYTWYVEAKAAVRRIAVVPPHLRHG